MGKSFKDSKGRIIIGGNKFALKAVSLSEMEKEKVYTYFYEAKRSGTAYKGADLPKDSYDRTPLITPISIQSQYLDALNVHYLRTVSDKTRFVLTFRTGRSISKDDAMRCFHRYRYDRFKSKIYEVVDLFVDPYILATTADWQTINA